MEGIFGAAGAFVEVGMLVVVAGLCGDGGKRCYESEEESIDGRHDVYPKSYGRDFVGYRRKVKIVEQEHKNEETLILYSSPARSYFERHIE